MSARRCRSCDYNVLSEVVTACPNCGEALPGLLASSSGMPLLKVAAVLIAGAAGWVLLRQPGAAPPPPVPPASAPGPKVGRSTMPASPAARRAASTAPSAASPRPPATPTRAPVTTPLSPEQVDRLIALLKDPAHRWDAAGALGRLDDPRAQAALMRAYNRREFTTMAGATAYYARVQPPGYEKVLLDLLRSSKDLAVAQDLILSGDARLADPAQRWAADMGFKLVRSRSSPNGMTWAPLSDPAR